MSLAPNTRLRSAAVLTVLTLSILAIFGQTRDFAFVAWDDPDYVTRNEVVRAGLTREGVAWAFAGRDAVNWHPLTWLSHMLDVELFGSDAGGHHATNVALHFFNSALVYFVFLALTGALGRSAALALLFAIHPVHVEPVAWVSERKELLCTFFSLLAIGGHVARVRRGGRLSGLLPIVPFAFALMAKPMAVTLPFVLLLLDVWPLRREVGWRLVVEKGPLFALSAFVSGVAVLTQSGGGAVVSLAALPIGARLANAVASGAAYLWDSIWPIRLIHFHPHPYLPATGGEPLSGFVIAASAALLVVISIAVFAARTRPWAWVGWCWFLGTLVPVIGLVQVGQQGRADRYLYFPSIGLFLIFVWAMAEVVERANARTRRAGWLGPSLSVAALLLLGVLAWRQTGHWRDSGTLFRHAVDVEPRNVLVRYNVASQLRDEGRPEEAIAEYERILEITPDYADARVNLANVLRSRGELDRAIDQYERALEAASDHRLAHLNLASALRQRGEVDRALEHFESALALGVDRVALFNLGNLHRSEGRHDEAIPLYERALALDERDARVHSALGLSLLAEGRLDAAIERLRSAVRLDLRDAGAANNLGVAYEEKGEIDAAIDAYRMAIGRMRSHPRAHSNLALLLVRRGELDEARRHFEQALAIDPENGDAHRGLEAIESRRSSR